MDFIIDPRRMVEAEAGPTHNSPETAVLVGQPKDKMSAVLTLTTFNLLEI